MSNLKNTIDLIKAIVAYVSVLTALVAPLGVAIWAGYKIAGPTDNHFSGAMCATALSLPGLFLGLILSRFLSLTFLSTWGKGHE